MLRSWPQRYPSITNWWARATRFNPLVWLYLAVMSGPKVYPVDREMEFRWLKNSKKMDSQFQKGAKKTLGSKQELHILHSESKIEETTSSIKSHVPAPRGDSPQPTRSSGSDQTKSDIGPSWGTSWKRSKARASSSVWILGDRPPWRQKILPATNAVMGKKSKRRVNSSQTLAEPYLRRHSS